MNTPVVLEVGRFSTRRRRLPERYATTRQSSASRPPSSGRNRTYCAGSPIWGGSLASTGPNVQRGKAPDAPAASARHSPCIHLAPRKVSTLDLRMDCFRVPKSGVSKLVSAPGREHRFAPIPWDRGVAVLSVFLTAGLIGQLAWRALRPRFVAG